MTYTARYLQVLIDWPLLGIALLFCIAIPLLEWFERSQGMEDEP